MLIGSSLTTLRADAFFSSSEESALELEPELELESEAEPGFAELELDSVLDELELGSESESELELLSLLLSSLRDFFDFAARVFDPDNCFPDGYLS